MKYLSIIHIGVFFIEFIHSFAPCFIDLSFKSKSLIKTLSGILEKYIYISQPVENPNSIIEIDTEQYIIPGYMDHDPKLEAMYMNL